MLRRGSPKANLNRSSPTATSISRLKVNRKERLGTNPISLRKMMTPPPPPNQMVDKSFARSLSVNSEAEDDKANERTRWVS
jgi:hypothetical protein